MAKKTQQLPPQSPIEEYIFDHQLKMLYGEDVMIAPARIFCRRAGEAYYYDDATKTHIASGPRTMFGGAAIGNLLRPEVDEDQLVLAQLVIIPRQIYTVKPKSVSPGHGMRMDQILTSGSCLDPRFWDRRLK